MSYQMNYELNNLEWPMKYEWVSMANVLLYPDYNDVLQAPSLVVVLMTWNMVLVFAWKNGFKFLIIICNQKMQTIILTIINQKASF